MERSHFTSGKNNYCQLGTAAQVYNPALRGLKAEDCRESKDNWDYKESSLPAWAAG